MVVVFLWFFTSIALFFPPNISAHSEIHVIEMTANGFEPQSLTVDINSSVIFINKDNTLRWPASNTHPTHDIFPEFDSRRSIEPGQSWPFKPSKPGEWKYHDHNFPHMRGVIIVVKEETTSINSESIKPINSIKSFITAVQDTISNFLNKVKDLISMNNRVKKQIPLPSSENFKKLNYDMQSSKLREISDEKGPVAAWNYIKDVFKGEGGSSGNIHDLAHFSGILLYEKFGFEGIRECDSQFAFGCYHGFLDKAFEKNLDQLPLAQDACLQLNTKGAKGVEGPAASCIHGIGHGVASFHQTLDLKKALVSCRQLTTGNEYCYDGVFMEFARSAGENFYKSTDPLYPCNQLEKEFGYAYSFSCGRNQPSILMTRFQMGFEEVVGVCNSATSQPFKSACFDALGFSIAATGDVGQIIAGCQKIGIDEFVASCLKAAAGELVFQEIPGWQDKSKQVCNANMNGQKTCMEHIERLIKEYGRTSFQFKNMQNGADKDSYVRSQMKICYELGGKDGCYKEVADLLFGQFGLIKTLSIFKKNEGYPEIYARCHEVTHYLSRLAFKKEKSIAGVYRQCDSTCHGGCYHGTLEAYLKEQLDETQDELSDYFASVCGDPNDYQKPIEYNECIHGMGHAAMFVTDMELPQSLMLCDTISEQQYKERCYTGVFMENSSSSTSFDHRSKYIKTDDPFYPCNSLEEKYQTLCWQYQSSYFSILTNQDWKKVAELCLQIPGKYQDPCFRTVGTNQVGFTTSLPTMKKDCDLMPTEHFKNVCVIGVVSSLSYRFVGDMQKMVDFCMLVDGQNKESCYKQIGYGIADWDKNSDLVKAQCKKISDKDGLSWCLNAI